MIMTESWQKLSPFWNCSTDPQKNQILILDHSEYLMKATMFEKSVITKLIYPNIKIPIDCPPMAQSWGFGILRFTIPSHNLYVETLLQKQLGHNKAYPSVNDINIG